MVNSKNKGSTYERKIVKLLKSWTGEDFQRAPSSGAWGTNSKRDDFRGDITCTNPKFRYSIECKKYKTWTLESIMISDKSPIWKWWEQCITQTPANKDPLLIFSKNNSPDFCISTKNLVSMEYPFFSFTKPGIGYYAYIFTLEDLLKQDPKSAFLEH